MNINDILNMDISDISKLNRTELAKLVSQLGSASNKRLKRMESKDMTTPATMGIKRSGGKISVAGKNVNELRSEFMRAKTFLSAKTSTQKGFKQVQKSIEQRIGGPLTPNQTKEFWQGYNKLMELEPNFLKLYGSDRMQQFLRSELVENGKMSEELLNTGIAEINRMYEENEGSINGTSGFFELGEDL